MKSFDPHQFINWVRDPKNQNNIIDRVTGLLSYGYFDSPIDLIDFLEKTSYTGKNEAVIRTAHATGIRLENPKYLRKAKTLGIDFNFSEAEIDTFHYLWEESLQKAKGITTYREKTYTEAKEKQMSYLFSQCPIEIAATYD